MIFFVVMVHGALPMDPLPAMKDVLRRLYLNYRLQQCGIDLKGQVSVL